MSAADSDFLEASVRHIVESDTLRWIFVGGKGGVGKTTISSSLGLLLAQTPVPASKLAPGESPRNRRVLVVSTDPAHNLSDAFDQKIGAAPTPIRGVSTLFAVELDCDANPLDEIDDAAGVSDQMEKMLGKLGLEPGLLKDLTESSSKLRDAVGIKEEMSLVQAMVSIADRDDFDIIVFDTAPTGHTLKLLALPSTASSFGVLDKLGGMLEQVGSTLGLTSGGADGGLPSSAGMRGKLKETLQCLKRFGELIHDPDATTFVCVCIAESLSLYETERLVQALAKEDVSVATVVCNQLLMRADSAEPCGFCSRRLLVQRKYLEQAEDLYGDLFHLIKLPLLPREVRGVDGLRLTASMLMTPFDPNCPPDGYDAAPVDGV